MTKRESVLTLPCLFTYMIGTRCALPALTLTDMIEKECVLSLLCLFTYMIKREREKVCFPKLDLY